ncbi:hypothetical protein [Paraburkholderia sediminicola]|uniref:hypothetical protein n=1 Tax=Paraburkholderia sediminicola TaxID=458836 RepID=UPI0038B8783D
MKRFIFALLSGLLSASSAHSSTDSMHIGPVPVVEHRSRALENSLKALRLRIERDARKCVATAKGMDVSGRYDAALKKIIETSRVVVIEVSATMMCDGVHPSSYRYAIALDTTSGKRIDLNGIYKVGVHQDGRLFLRRELIDAATDSYRKENVFNSTCLNEPALENGLSSNPLTIAPLADGGVSLYYATPDVEAGCFPVLTINRRELIPYRNAQRAAEFDLP